MRIGIERRTKTMAVIGSMKISVSWMSRALGGTVLLGFAVLVAAPEALRAEKISNPIAEFIGLDKITGQIRTFDVQIDETVQFGALQLTPRVCYSRPPTEAPRTTVFVEVDEVTLDRKIQKIFSGWMFADSPGLNAVDHPIYDVWLSACKAGSEELGIGN